MTFNPTFINPALLDEALTHRSYLNENPQVKSHNERLEFLGDAVLELVISHFLFEKFPDKPEGELTAYRAALVRTNTLAEVSTSLGLGDQLKLSKGEAISGGRTNPSLLANTCEAVIGAIYLDQGMSAASTFIHSYLVPKIDDIINKKLFKDAKSTLQELVQSQGFEAPDYKVVSEIGPDHDKQFQIAAVINGQTYGVGEGKNKQTAQQHAAESALEKFNQH